ncbi:hypothetical protein KRP22_000439 [Phytophthora ramorum]|uniref:RING-type domain-containing protein n=1 Tax=Phytophthora ramorum TaxID=164328 RepID=H3GCA1_PHYRM|nr:E3 ubiquitin-protein ligase RDUF2 [Phytophthora ramorum]
MELQLNVNVCYDAQPSESIGDVLHHFESPAWVRLVLRQVLPQLKQISPTDPAALTKMVRDAEMSRTNAEQEISCAICMGEQRTVPLGTTDAVALELPCGHRFHSDCVRSWLTRRSTCPLCRFELPKAYTGTFAIAAMGSMLLLPPEHQHILPSELLSTSVTGRMLQAVVKITMIRISPDLLLSATRHRRPCQVTVAMLHANGSSADIPHAQNAKRRREERTSDDMTGVFKRVRTSA